MRYILTISMFAIFLLLAADQVPLRHVAGEPDPETPVWDVLAQLGDSLPDHEPRLDVEGASAEVGRRLVLEGLSQKADGGDTDRQSKHFLCTSCHNVEREDPDLRRADPEARLDYVAERGLPFLAGTTLYGVVNRTSFYNGDYEKKYGDLVKPTRHNLRAAIQLCATECSQGRALEDWEMESVMAYLWTIGLKMKDLDLSDREWQQVKAATSGSGDAEAARQLLHDHYLSYSPATFETPPPDRKAGYGEEGRPERGQLIYELSCLHCHGEQRYSFFHLDDSRYSHSFLTKHFPRYTRYSTYQVVRYGTSPINGKKAYMPHYPLEKMSNRQVEDLRVYLEQEREATN